MRAPLVQRTSPPHAFDLGRYAFTPTRNAALAAAHALARSPTSLTRRRTATDVAAAATDPITSLGRDTATRAVLGDTASPRQPNSSAQPHSTDSDASASARPLLQSVPEKKKPLRPAALSFEGGDIGRVSRDVKGEITGYGQPDRDQSAPSTPTAAAATALEPAAPAAVAFTAGMNPSQPHAQQQPSSSSGDGSDHQDQGGHSVPTAVTGGGLGFAASLLQGHEDPTELVRGPHTTGAVTAAISPPHHTALHVPPSPRIDDPAFFRAPSGHTQP